MNKAAENINPYDEGSILLFNKPLGITSFGLVKRIRWATRAKKVGHAGTLDPLASGLMILCTGKFTKRISEFQDLEKEYTGTFTIGATRPSFDMETEIDRTCDYSHVSNELIDSAVKNLTGEIMQVPPVFSAMKINGKRAYDMARSNQEVTMEARKITVHSFEITRIELPEVDFKIVCSKGTYIRSIANDFGEALGCGAYLSALCRTRIGEYRLEDAHDPEEFIERLRPQKTVEA